MPCAGLRHEHARCGRLITKLRPFFNALNVGDDSTDPAQMKLGTLPNTSSSTKLTRSDATKKNLAVSSPTPAALLTLTTMGSLW